MGRSAGSHCHRGPALRGGRGFGQVGAGAGRREGEAGLAASGACVYDGACCPEPRSPRLVVPWQPAAFSCPLATLSSAAATYTRASDTGRGGPVPPSHPAGVAARAFLSSGSRGVVPPAAPRRPEAGVGPGLGGKRSSGLLGLLHPRPLPPRPHPLRCPKPAESRRPERARREEREREGRGRAGCGPSHVRGGWGEGSCSRCLVAAQEPPRGFAFGGGRSHSSSPAIGRRGASRPGQREKPRGGWSGALIRPAPPPRSLRVPPTRELSRRRSSWNAPQNPAGSDGLRVRSFCPPAAAAAAPPNPSLLCR